ncbi:MAG: relaxase/mobilization nuclease domain-containing protein [Bacteroidota bacterium]
MVAKITLGKSIRGILNYNETKVQQEQAQVLLASGFATDIDQLNLNQKIDRFRKLHQQRPDVKTNAAHITLNFDKSDQLDAQKLQQIAQTYMEQIGFGDQPYIVYQHHDAHHPHLHIATTLIQKNTDRIYTHRIGELVSEPARKRIEIQFGLIKAQGRKQNYTLGIKPAVYGKRPTKQQLSSIIVGVKENYAFTSLAEFNAVLRQFNVQADRGNEDTKMFEKKGLLYSILDENGNPVGVPIKASRFHSQPTLEKLEKRFLAGIEERKPLRENLKRRIESVLQKYEGLKKETLVNQLGKQQIGVAFRQNETGLIYGVTFIDHRQRAVFNGSDLGKAFSARAITEKLSLSDELKTYLKAARPIGLSMETEQEKSNRLQQRNKKSQAKNV